MYFWSGPCKCTAIRSPFETKVPDFQFTEVGMGFIKESALLNSVVEFSQKWKRNSVDSSKSVKHEFESV